MTPTNFWTMMKILKNKLIALDPAEFDIGALLNNDEVFEKAKSKLRPEVILNPDLKKLVEIMKAHGNSVETIMEIDKETAYYAIILANHVAAWTIQMKESNYESLSDAPNSHRNGAPGSQNNP